MDKSILASSNNGSNKPFVFLVKVRKIRGVDNSKKAKKMDKKTSRKILLEMATEVKFIESLPKSRKIEERKWNDGLIFGMKHLTLLVSRMTKDPKIEKFYRELLEMEKEEEKLLGADKIKLMNEILEKNKKKAK